MNYQIYYKLKKELGYETKHQLVDHYINSAGFEPVEIPLDKINTHPLLLNFERIRINAFCSIKLYQDSVRIMLEFSECLFVKGYQTKHITQLIEEYFSQHSPHHVTTEFDFVSVEFGIASRIKHSGKWDQNDNQICQSAYNFLFDEIKHVKDFLRYNRIRCPF